MRGASLVDDLSGTRTSGNCGSSVTIERVPVSALASVGTGRAYTAGPLDHAAVAARDPAVIAEGGAGASRRRAREDEQAHDEQPRTSWLCRRGHLKSPMAETG